MNPETKNSILIVDDDPLNLRALMNILSDEYTVYAERGGVNCLESAERLQPDLILLDVLMPDMSGFDVIKALKNNTETREIPIIFITGLIDTDDEVTGFMFGAADYIHKPLVSHIVKVRVRQQMKIINLIREIQNLSITDPLTGIGNRRYFNTLLNREWERAKRNQTPLSFMLLDIDNFKQLNDRYGHLNGDTTLQTVARIFGQKIERAGDTFARWGGEEFAVILPDTASAGALKVAEAIRAAVAETVIQFDDGRSTDLTVSIGLHCVIPDRIESYDIDRLITKADEALYFAKTNGKNRVCTAEECA